MYDDAVRQTMLINKARSLSQKVFDRFEQTQANPVGIRSNQTMGGR